MYDYLVMIDQPIYTIKETATLFRVTRTTVERWITQGHLKVVYLRPRVPRVPKAEIERILAGER